METQLSSILAQAQYVKHLTLSKHLEAVLQSAVMLHRESMSLQSQSVLLHSPFKSSNSLVELQLFMLAKRKLNKLELRSALQMLSLQMIQKFNHLSLLFHYRLFLHLP